MSNSGIKPSRHALHHHHGLLQKDELGPRLHVEDLGDLEEQAEQLCHGDLAGAVPVDRLADRTERLRKILRRMDGRHIARLDVHLGDALVVAADEAVEDLRQEARSFGPDAAHDAEIDGDEPPVRVDEEVPLVHVGVEESVAERVAEEGLHDRCGDASWGRGRRRGSRSRSHEARALDPFGDEHVAAGKLPVRPPARGNPLRSEMFSAISE